MRIAFIGGHGHHYLRNLLPDPAWEVAVASDGIDPDAAQKFRLKLPGKSLWFDSPTALWEQFKPDVVNIGAVYTFNGNLAAQALERDIAVVSDKPIAADWATLDRLRALTQQDGRVLLTEFPFRCRPEFRAVRQAVQDGQIGEVVLATAQKSYRFGAARPAWYARRDYYPGTLFWVASHGVDAIHFCSGLPLSPVMTVGSNLSRPDYAPMEDHVVTVFGLANGGHAVVHADFLRPQAAPTHGDDRLRIAGTQGIVEVQEGRCRLITGSEDRDITHTAEARPVEQELMAAVHAEESVYSTGESLRVAEVLLQAHDAMRHQTPEP